MIPAPYPDISELLASKAQRRLTLAALSWEEKVAIVEKMRTLAPKGKWQARPANPTFPTQAPRRTSG